jgi:hypothetical protein
MFLVGWNNISGRLLACARLAQRGASESSAQVFEGMDTAGHHDTWQPRPGAIHTVHTVHTYIHTYIHTCIHTYFLCL